MTNQLDQIIVACKHKVDSENAGPSEIVTFLHERGLNIIESIKIVREVFNVSLGESKKLVSTHPAWTEVVGNSEPLHNELMDALEADKVSDDP